MRKTLLFALCSLFFLPQANAASQKQSTAQKQPAEYYLGLRLHKMQDMNFDVEIASASGSRSEKTGQFGFGIFGGERLTDWFKLGAEISYTSVNLDTTSWVPERFRAINDDSKQFMAINAMADFILDYRGFSMLSPYAGVSLGVANASLGSGVSANLSYGVMVGLNWMVSDRILLDIGAKYQDYGYVKSALSRSVKDVTSCQSLAPLYGEPPSPAYLACIDGLPIGTMNSQATVHVTAIDLYVGAAYRF
jgi:opacity protein-like surface antigen